MIALLLVTHGPLAEAFIRSAEMILGPQSDLIPVSLTENDNFETLRKRLLHAAASADQGDGVLILCDIPGGTPANAAALLTDRPNIAVLTGLNLGMLLEALLLRETVESVEELAARVLEAGRESITDVRERLAVVWR